MSVTIGNSNVGEASRPFIIAEMSGNHNQSLERALMLVDAAAESGASAIKLQTYKADTMTLDVQRGSFEITDSESLWSGKNLYELYNLAYTPWEWHEFIINHARKRGLICFSSPFDETAIDFLEQFDLPAYKIASFENNYLPLIRKAASTGKPLIMSTGMASLGELEQAVGAARDSGCKELILLKCTSTYPATADNTNLLTIPHLKTLFNCQVGLSDHTLGLGVSVASVALGATVIEKHFTLSRKDGGVDSSFSLEPDEFKQLVQESNRAWEALGIIKYGPTEAEKKSMVFRRSLYVSEDIAIGETFTHDNIKIVRPGDGAPPYFIDFIIGKQARRAYSKGDPLSIEKLL